MAGAVRLGLALAVTFVIACGSETRTASVVVPADMGGASLLVQVGRSWNVGHDLPRKASMGQKLRVPVGAAVVVPFLDLDQDGRLDKLLEPSADCGKSAGFACQLRQSRLIVRRSQRQRLQHSEDITVVFGESYLTRPVRPDPAARLCQDQPGSCVERTAQSQYADIKDALALKLCAFEDPNMAQTAQLVHLRSGDRAVLSAKVRRPPAMNLRASLERRDGQLMVVGAADLPVDHLVVWVGRYDESKQEMNGVRWTSERPDARFQITGQRFEAVVPESELACPECVVGVQVAHDVSLGEVSVGTEALLLLRARGQS